MSWLDIIGKAFDYGVVGVVAVVFGFVAYQKDKELTAERKARRKEAAHTATLLHQIMRPNSHSLPDFDDEDPDTGVINVRDELEKQAGEYLKNGRR